MLYKISNIKRKFIDSKEEIPVLGGYSIIEVHHIGKKSENNARNLLIVTSQQHNLIHKKGMIAEPHN
jgi:hypothetical protein